MWKLTGHVSADDVVVNLVEAGFIKNMDITRDTPILLKPLSKVFAFTIWRSITLGASTYLDAAITQGNMARPHELGNLPVRSSKINESTRFNILLIDKTRYPGFLYTERGREFMERLWQETLNEF